MFLFIYFLVFFLFHRMDNLCHTLKKKKGRMHFFLNGCLLCLQLTCQRSHSQIGAISGFSSVMNESGPPPIEDSYPGSVQSPSMWGVSILGIKITEPFLPIAAW